VARDSRPDAGVSGRAHGQERAIVLRSSRTPAQGHFRPPAVFVLVDRPLASIGPGASARLCRAQLEAPVCIGGDGRGVGGPSRADRSSRSLCSETR